MGQRPQCRECSKAAAGQDPAPNSSGRTGWTRRPQSPVFDINTVFYTVYSSTRPNDDFPVSYRTVVRPSYKVAYRQVTALEWRCCPGFAGDQCQVGKHPHL